MTVSSLSGSAARPDPAKLAGFPPVFWINLDRDAARRAHMQALCADWGLKATRIPAIDAAETPPDAFLTGAPPLGVTPARLACYASHLQAMATFVAASDAPFAVIMEDDVSFDTAPYWPFDWRFIRERLPYDLDTLQLATVSTGAIRMRLHRRYETDYSAACYMISWRHAEKLTSLLRPGGAPRFDRRFWLELTSETMVFDSGAAYSLPLFTIEPKFGSNLRPEHIDPIHRPSREKVMGFWRDRAPDIKDWEALMRPQGDDHRRMTLSKPPAAP